MEIEFIMQILSNQSMFNFACFMFICCAFVWLCEKARSYIIRLIQYITKIYNFQRILPMQFVGRVLFVSRPII